MTGSGETRGKGWPRRRCAHRPGGEDFGYAVGPLAARAMLGASQTSFPAGKDESLRSPAGRHVSEGITNQEGVGMCLWVVIS